jgi:hypothetical protein
MKVPRFDIFFGTDKNAQWIEVVEGLDAASRRMEFRAAKFPGKYFVFNCSEHTIADSIDTTFRIVGRLRRENEPTGMPPTWGLDHVRLPVTQAETVPEFKRFGT